MPAYRRIVTSVPAVHVVLHGVVLAVLLAVCLSRPAPRPENDALRYIILGVNLYAHGVLSDAPYRPDVSPPPSLPNGGPLIAPEIALAMAMDGTTRHSLLCFETGEQCEFRIPGLRVLHAVELWIFLICLWLVACRILGRPWSAWAVVGAALLCQEMIEARALVLTESLFLGVLGPFLWAWMRWLARRDSVRDAALLGLSLAVICLVKPVFMILVPVLPLAALPLPILRRGASPVSWRTSMAGLAYAAVILAVLGGVMAYHHACCGVAALSSPRSLEETFAARVGFNAMSWREWLVGWIYFLPDFGDGLARSLFPRQDWVKLGWEAGGYLANGTGELIRQARAAAPDGAVVRHLIEIYVLPDVAWHSVVSLLMLWRGIFIGKLWGLVALPFVLWLATRVRVDRTGGDFLLLAAPLVLVAVVQAVMSVSISRYNLGLIAPYSIAFVWGIEMLARRWRSLRVPARPE